MDYRSLPVFRRHSAALLLLPLVWCVAHGGEAKVPAGKTESSEGQLNLNFLPKAFQKNPLVDQTVVTEMTDLGRKMPLTSADIPGYFVAQAAGYHLEGHGPAVEQPPPETVLANCLNQALAINHFLPASPGHPPTFLILYTWGVHNNLDKGSDDVVGAFPDVGHKNLLGRAALVGGTKFAAELRTVLEQHYRQSEVMTVAAVLDPLYLFVERDWKTKQLYEQSLADCYYVVASAYDYGAGARGERKLLWRSKMTVDARGVSMADTLPTLILNGGVYLGRDMPEAATISKRINRTGSTKLAPLEVKAYLNDRENLPEKTPVAQPKDEPKP